MTSEEMEKLLAKPLDAVVAVNRPSGGPHLTPVWFRWDGHAFYLSTTRDRAKYTHIKRHPDISLIVDDQAAHRYVVAYGRAEIVEDDPNTIAELSYPIIAKYAPQVPKPAPAEFAEEGRVVVVLRPTRLVTR